MQLNDYLKRKGQSQRDFGITLVPPASQALVSQWILGITRVTLAYALQIEKTTGGDVTPQDCADMYRGNGPGKLPALSAQPA